MVKLLYLILMSLTQDAKHLIYERLRRIVDKHVRVDEQPFSLSDSVKLSPREVRAIEFLGQSDTVNVTNVATHFHFTKSAASQLINRLVKRDLVNKEVAPNSDKEYRLTLTADGEAARQLIADMNQSRLDMFLEAIHDFSDKETTATANVLGALEKLVDRRLRQFK
ncbi:MarR family winged helix-turn-helix transcriptional regulator [Pseudodesulfovibrio sediminis]|uniref:HTH marR-type domain-containing protein n=1 Tax=Pseudodesulfovibrio sediminis TaxID=2810563 RepID=A0ABM7P385_9BACT|nr:MarR family transcriptional regulator [Pseudodesulfovibrio sediminis]BCS88119.1 hypothetical protein PSDVSF_13610 [Pseudodesulfovibrio sediminis]